MKTPDISDGSQAVLKVAMCQVYTEQWKIELNATRTLAAIDDAARKGAELAITPECVFHGYGFDDVEDYAAAMGKAAEPIDGPHFTAVQKKAKEHGIYVSLGFAEKAENGSIHNSVALFSPKGEIMDLYRKVHCRPFESIEHDGVFVPGDTFSVHEVKGAGGKFQLGTMICFDREIPESVRSLRALGAQVISCPLATNTSDMTEYINYADNEMITRCRAAENEVFILVVNHAGRYNGGSFAVGPGGELIHQMGPEPGVVVLDLPVGGIAKKFHSDPYGWMGWGYRRQEVYDRALGR